MDYLFTTENLYSREVVLNGKQLDTSGEEVSAASGCDTSVLLQTDCYIFPCYAASGTCAVARQRRHCRGIHDIRISLLS